MGDEEGGSLAEQNEHQLHQGIGITGIADKAFGLAEGLGVGEMLHHAAPLLMPGIGALLGPLGALAGGLEIGEGVKEYQAGDKAGGIVTGLQGVAGMIGGGGSALGATAASMEYAGLGAGVLEGAGPVGAAAGVGLAAGTGLNAIANSDATRTGFWGKDDGGRNKSAALAAADVGVDESLYGDWTFGGAAKSMGAGVGAALASPVQALYHMSGLSDGVDVATSTMSNLIGGAGRGSYGY